MKNIFKRKKDTAAQMEIFKNWTEMEKEDLKKEIKAQKTKDLKEILRCTATGVLIGLGTTVIGVILNELVNRD